MKSKTTVFAALLVAAAMALFAPRQAKAEVTFSYFYEGLIPYGDWVDVDQYGYCWAPRGMAADWRPYTDGYWTYTDAGWTWVSYEDFGSITYHYGRWVRLEDVGWVWKPDYRWGPAWVSWRQSDNYMGWAPLPPDVSFNDDSGVGVWVDRDYDIGPSSYTFCETRYFGAPVMRNVIVPVRRNVEILDMTVNITNITFINSHDHGRLVYCGGPDYRWLAARSERPINRLELVLRTDGDWLHRRRPELSRSVGAQLFINAPVIEAPRERFAPPRVAREIRAPRIDRGWGSVADPGMRERIHQRYQEQTRGLTRQTAPAYRVNEAEVRNFVREPRPVPAGAPGAIQTMQQNVQRAPQQGQQTMQQPQQQVQSAVQPSGQPMQFPRRMHGSLQPQTPTDLQRAQPSVQPVQSVQGPATSAPQVPQAPQVQRTPSSDQRRPSADQERNPQRQPQEQIQRKQADQQQRQAAENARNPQRQQQEQIQRNQADQQQRQAAENARNPQRQQQEQIQRNQADQQQRQAAENARNQQRQPQEQIQRKQAEQQQRQAGENARNQQRQQQEQIQRKQAEQQQRQAAENARNQQRQQQEQIQRNQADQQQRQAAENARNQQRQQQEQIQRNQAEQQQRQAAENARNQQRQQQIQRNQADQQQRQAAENARNQQRQQEQQFQRRENAAPQGQQSRDNRDNNDHKKHDRLNDPNNGN